MIEPRVGFIVYGVHKDGLKDPMGEPFIDDSIVKRSKEALTRAGLKLVVHKTVIATKEEAVTALRSMKNDEEVDAVVLFSGTWVWAAHLAGAIRDRGEVRRCLLHPCCNRDYIRTHLFRCRRHAVGMFGCGDQLPAAAPPDAPG